MKQTIATPEKIKAVAAEWNSLEFKTWAKGEDARLYVNHRKTSYGYIDLVAGAVYPNQQGRSYRSELTSILNDLKK